MSNETDLTRIANTTLAQNYSYSSREELIDILSTFQKIGFAVPYFIIEPLALVLNFLTLYILRKREDITQSTNGKQTAEAVNTSED